MIDRTTPYQTNIFIFFSILYKFSFADPNNFIISINTQSKVKYKSERFEWDNPSIIAVVITDLAIN